MAGLPKKFAKMGFKKGWAAFNKTRGAKKRKPAKSSHKKKSKARKSTGKPEVKQMAKRKKSHSKKSHSKKTHSRSKMRGQRGFGVVDVLISGGYTAAGGIASAMLVNKVPKVKDMPAWAKAAAQGSVGLVAILTGGRRNWQKFLGAGAVAAALMRVAKNSFNLNPLAGPSAGTPTLTPAQMARLTGRMSIPADVRMSRPADVRMSRPADVVMNGNGFVPGLRF